MDKQVKLSLIKSNKDNPRLIKDDKFKKLVKSIKDFPEMLKLRPIVVDEDMTILGGNMRYKACVQAGLTEVPIKIAKGLTEDQKKEFTVKDNVGFGEWDWDMLGNEWDNVKLGEWGMDVWQPEEDIKEILEFNESINFIVKCENIKQLEELQEKLNVKGQKTEYRFIINKIK